MPLITTECIVLRSQPYSETSKILRLLTPDHGARSVIAKGALRPRSRYGGVLEPFAVGRAAIYLNESRDLHTLGGFDLSHTGQALGRDLIRFGTASLLTEIVLRTTSEEADPTLFKNLVAALERIKVTSSELLEPLGLAEAWTLIAYLGFAPIVDRCTSCGRGLEADDDTFFDYAAGGTRCRSCGGDSANTLTRALPAHARQMLTHFIAGEQIRLERTAAHWALLSRFLAYHLSEGGPLHSLQFLGEAVAVGRAGVV